MPNFIDQLGQQAATTATGGILGAGMGLILEHHNDQRQINQQKKLTDIQIAADKQLSDYNFAKQLQMWKDTSYSAQVEQMKKAGINPALLYGIGGGGGQSTGGGSQSAAAATAGQNPGESMGIIMQEMQLGLLKAQKENIEASTKKTLSEVPVNQATVPNLQANTTLTQMQTRWEKIKSEIAEETKEDQIGLIINEVNKSNLDIQNQVQTNKITRDTANDQIKLVHQQAIGAAIENELKKANIRKTEAEIQQIANAIEQKWTELELQGRGLDINEFRAVIDANNPTLGQTLGNMVNSVKRKVDMIMGIKNNYVRPNQVKQ